MQKLGRIGQRFVLRGEVIKPARRAERLDRRSRRLSDCGPDLPGMVRERQRSQGLSTSRPASATGETHERGASSSARQDCEALRDVPTSEQAHDVPVDRSYRTADSASFSERIGLFVERVRDYKAKVQAVRPTELSQAITSACESQGRDTAVVPADLPV